MLRIFKKHNGGYLFVLRKKSKLTNKERDFLLLLAALGTKNKKVENVISLNELGE